MTGTRPLPSGSGTYFVAWIDYDDNVRGARVGTDGTVLDPTAIPIAVLSSSLNPNVAWNGQNYLVVWEDWRHGTEDILGTRVAPDGSQLDPHRLPHRRDAGR